MTTFPLTIGTETRNVEVRDVWQDGRRFQTCQPVGAYRWTAAGKVWAGRVDFWRQADGTYRPSRTTTILNRSGYVLVGWADAITKTGASKHNSALEAGR